MAILLKIEKSTLLALTSGSGVGGKTILSQKEKSIFLSFGHLSV